MALKRGMSPSLSDSRGARDDSFAGLGIKTTLARGFFLEFGVGVWFAVTYTNVNV